MSSMRVGLTSERSARAMRCAYVIRVHMKRMKRSFERRPGRPRTHSRPMAMSGISPTITLCRKGPPIDLADIDGARFERWQLRHRGGQVEREAEIAARPFSVPSGRTARIFSLPSKASATESTVPSPPAATTTSARRARAGSQTVLEIAVLVVIDVEIEPRSGKVLAEHLGRDAIDQSGPGGRIEDDVIAARHGEAPIPRH